MRDQLKAVIQTKKSGGNKMKVKIAMNETAKDFGIPHPKKHGDVGYDLHANTDVIIYADNMINRLMNFARACIGKAPIKLGMANIPTGIRLEMPDGIWATIEARSSTCQKMLFTAPSIMDTGYRGEFFIVLYNLGKKNYKIVTGQRLAQIVFHQAILPTLIEVDQLSDSERGASGFGHTGV